MWFDGVVRIMGNIDISGIKSLVEEVPESAWEKDWRKKVNPNFNDSHSLWMTTMPFSNDAVFHIFDSSITCEHESFREEYFKFQKELETLLDGIVVRSCIIRLTPGNVVKRHIDGRHAIFRHCYRIIIPVLTNDRSALVYDDQEFILEEGIVYDTNPFLPHSTYNRGNSNRYQAVIDVFPRDSRAKVELKKYSDWDEDLCKSLEPKLPTRNRNAELDVWEERFEREKDRVCRHKTIFKYSGLSDDDA